MFGPSIKKEREKEREGGREGEEEMKNIKEHFM